MKIELTLKTTYLPSWGTWEGLRELVQNGRDAEVEFNAPLTVELVNGTLRIENEGCTLPHEALLMGHTSKADRANLIGQFGEGLKLGILALVRAGRTVKIRSGSEVWTPSICKSDKFNADVLVFDVQGGREQKNRVRVEIGGVSETEWAETKSRFLFLAKPKKGDRVSVHEGDLLLEEAQKGRIFVKGIFVQSSPDLNYGYNFNNIDVDRDRKMLNGWDVEYSTRRIWQGALIKEPKLYQPFMDLVESEAKDTKSLDEYSVNSLCTEIAERAASDFLKKYGDMAVPVSNFNECQELEHLGRRGVVVNSQLRAVLGKVLGSLEEVKKNLKNEVVKTYSCHDLNREESLNLASVRCLVEDAFGIKFEASLQVVDFRTDNILGQYKDKTVFVAKKLLLDRHELLVTVIHEISHEAGGDGDKGHVAAMEKAYKALLVHLWK